MVSVKHFNQAISEHSRSYNLKIFFNHGEGKSNSNKPFQSIQEVKISKFSSTMVKVKAFQISHFRAFKKIFFNHGEGKSIPTKLFQSIQEVIISNIFFSPCEGKSIPKKPFQKLKFVGKPKNLVENMPQCRNLRMQERYKL